MYRRPHCQLAGRRWLIDDAIVGWYLEEPAGGLLAIDPSQAVGGFAKARIAALARDDDPQVCRKPTFVYAFDRSFVANRPCWNCDRRPCAFGSDALDFLSSE